MIVAVVRFKMNEPITPAKATEAFLASAPSYQGVPGLLRKHYVHTLEGDQAGGVYLWESKAAAEALYDEAWRQRIEARYGSSPTVEYFESPVMVDPDQIQDTETVYDTTHERFAEHVRKYLETGGVEGHIWRDAPTLLLTTRGRRSGRLRRTPLIYGRDGDDYVVVGSYKGRDRHPLWYENIRADPAVRLQVLDEVFPAVASTVEDDSERDRLWAIMCEIYPDYSDYQAATTRRIPVVRLRPA
jgi:deazaflavin-dependent oxidoreductase (nitroreductase family)